MSDNYDVILTMEYRRIIASITNSIGALKKLGVDKTDPEKYNKYRETIHKAKDILLDQYIESNVVSEADLDELIERRVKEREEQDKLNKLMSEIGEKVEQEVKEESKPLWKKMIDSDKETNIKISNPFDE